MSNIEYHHIKEELINRVLVILSVVVIPAVGFSLLRFFQIGWQTVYYIHIIMIPTFAILAFYRKKLSLSSKTIFLMSACLLLSIFGFLDFGLGSFGIQFLMLYLLLAVVFLKKIAIPAYVSSLIIIAVIGFLFIEGMIVPQVFSSEYNTYPSAWVSAFSSFAIVLGFVIFIVGSIGCKLNLKVRELNRMYEDLRKAHDEIKILRGIIPICSICKQIRDDSGCWNKLEAYIQDHSEAVFSHGICLDCGKKHYPELDIWDEYNISTNTRFMNSSV
jgi:hypothetical protein